jgi:hypothetical protein
MRLFSVLALLAAAAWAQDDGSHGDLGGGTTPPAEEPSGMDAIDIDIDLGPSVETFTYEGGYQQKSGGKMNKDASISVSNPSGTTVVNCTDTEYVEARVSYTIDGTDKGPMESYGNSIKMATTGGGTTGSVKVSIGSKPSAVKAAKVQLSVTVPKEAKLNVSSTSDWVQVNGCNGTVTANASKNGAYVSGNLRAFTVSAGSGDVKVVVGEGKITGNSAITASKGNATLIMPLAQDLKVNATGASVSVVQNVIGSVGATNIVGTMGAGGPTLNIKASGDVAIKTP